MRTPATGFEDLVVCKRKGSKNVEKQTNSELSQLLEEISKLLEPIRRPS